MRFHRSSSTPRRQDRWPLRIVNRHDFFDRLDVHHDQTANNQIQPKPGIDTPVSIQNRQRHLPTERNIPSLQLMGKALLVNRLQQSRPEHAMNRERRIDDLAGNQIRLSRRSNHLGVLASWR